MHGGGATVSAWLARMGIEARFVRGLRVTDAASLEVVVAVLAGLVNKQLVAELSALGAPAIGLSGADGLILQARRYDDELGFVGKIERVNPYADRGAAATAAPARHRADRDRARAARTSQLLNTNADTAAGEIAAALHAERLVFLTDVDGVLDADKRLLAHLTADEARALIASGVGGRRHDPEARSGDPRRERRLRDAHRRRHATGRARPGAGRRRDGHDGGRLIPACEVPVLPGGRGFWPALRAGSPSRR